MAVRTRDTSPVFKYNFKFVLQQSLGFIGSVSNSRRNDPLLQSMGAGNKLSFSISLDDSINTVLWCTGLLTSFAHDLPEGSRTWIPPIHHCSIPLAKPGSRKKAFWDVGNGCF